MTRENAHDSEKDKLQNIIHSMSSICKKNMYVYKRKKTDRIYIKIVAISSWSSKLDVINM